MFIGQNGSMLKQIGIAARQQIEEMSGRKVFLELRVKVEKIGGIMRKFYPILAIRSKNQRKRKNKKGALAPFKERGGRDSNPRSSLPRHSLSRRAQSATLAPPQFF